MNGGGELPRGGVKAALGCASGFSYPVPSTSSVSYLSDRLVAVLFNSFLVLVSEPLIRCKTHAAPLQAHAIHPSASQTVKLN